MEFENLLVAREGAVSVVSVNRPRVANALNSKTITELLELSTELEMDPAVRAVILTGSGEKAFVAGADIAEMAEMRPREARHFAELGGALMSAIESSDKPGIAAVNGVALGGGCELALACDMIVASDRAELGQPEILLGIIPGGGGTQRLARAIGKQRAMELVLTGRRISALEGYEMGLVNKV
jgi:enoyl-CoA hydratase